MKELWFKEIDSTNTFLKKHYQEFADQTFVRADHQSQGRGRNKRVWSDEGGTNLLYSLLIRDEKVIESFNVLSVLSAYTLIEVLEEEGITDLMIKWPNDVYHGDEKLCGILLEAVSFEKIECVIIGMGVNVNQKVFDGDYRQKPCSLFQIRKKKTDLEKFKDKLFERLLTNISLVKDGHDFYKEIVKYDYLKGKQAYIADKDEMIRIIGMDPDYSLRVISDDKELTLSSGEVSLKLKGDIL